MSQLPSYKRLYKTDFPADSQALVDQLSYTINPGFEALFNALNGGLDFSNFNQDVKDVNVTVDGSGSPIGGASFTISNTNPLVGLTVIRQVNTTNPTTYPTSGISVSYSQSGSKITLTNVTGLPANNTFALRIVAYKS